MQKKQKIITHQKNCRNLSANSLAIITRQKIRVNYIEEIIFKSDAVEHKYYQISKKLLKLSANPLAMITKQPIRINDIEEISM